MAAENQVAPKSEKKDGEGSKGNGRRVCLGDRMCSIPCCASCFASVDLEEWDEFNRDVTDPVKSVLPFRGSGSGIICCVCGTSGNERADYKCYF